MGAKYQLLGQGKLVIASTTPAFTLEFAAVVPPALQDLKDGGLLDAQGARYSPYGPIAILSAAKAPVTKDYYPLPDVISGLGVRFDCFVITAFAVHCKLLEIKIATMVEQV
jgi:hypothetical protein